MKNTHIGNPARTGRPPFGQCTFVISLGGLVITDVRYPPNLTLAMHRHEDAYLCIVLEGQYEETCAARFATVNAGAVINHPAHSEHANRFSDLGARCLNVTPTGEWRDSANWRELSLGARATSRQAPRDALLRLRAELAEGHHSSPIGVAAALFDLLYRSRERRLVAPPAWLRRVRDRLEFDGTKATLEDLARDACVHPAHLARSFRKWQGVSIGEYVRRQRLEHALQALAHTVLPLAELAQLAGYADQAHMTRTIKQTIGLTPRQYRAAMQNQFKNARSSQDRHNSPT